MRRYLALVLLVFVSIPAGISISGCTRNPAANYCNGLGYGIKITQLYAITLQPYATGISMAYAQTRQMTAPTGVSCKGTTVSVSSYSYGTTNNQLVDISPTGSLCAGTWNRNSGGGIADYTICNPPNPLPSTGGLPYGVAYITASADSIVSNPVEVYIHPPVSSTNLSVNGAAVGQQQCYSQTAVEQLDAEACYASNGIQYELCAPPTVTKYACPGGLAPGVTSVPDCSNVTGALTYTVGTSSVASINSQTNQITAELPGTTPITASVAGSGSSAGYFSTCPPAAVSLRLANGNTSGTVTQGVQQNLTTSVVDTNGNAITGLTLNYQSTNPLDITAGAAGAITAAFPGSASVYAVCEPATCNPSPINEIGVGSGTGLSISSNPVNITVPGTASAYLWFAAPGKSQYFVPVELLTGTLGTTVRLPYVPNSMFMDQAGTNLYFGSLRELMIYSTTSNSLTTQATAVPGVVLAVAPNAQTVLVNDQQRQVFYLYNVSGTIASTFGGMGTSAQWTPDSQTLYITDSSSAGAGHTDTLYVYNANTGWVTSSLTSSSATSNLAVTVPGVGAFVSGNPTVAHTWCPSGTVGNYNSMVFYPQGDTVPDQTDALAATTDGQHIIGAAALGGGITLTDIPVSIPNNSSTGTPLACPVSSSGALTPLTITQPSAPVQAPLNVTATSVDQVVTSPAAVTQGTAVAPYSLTFVTYNGTTPGATLPYYKQVAGASSTLGTVGYVTLNNASAITAPLAGAFSSDATQFFVSTAGDNLVHFINTTTLTDTQQVNPNLPACAPGSDPNCVFTTTTPAPASGVVPATAIAVKPRATS